MILLETFSEKMEIASVNSLICISVVFFVLIFMSFLISLFIHVYRAEQKIKDKKSIKAEEKNIPDEGIDKAISHIQSNEESLLTDDLELIAVIASAIASSTGTSTDDFVVKSIRKVNKSKWQNA